MSSFLRLILLLVLTGGCYCTPGTYGFGGTIGGKSELNFSLGGRADITPTGVSFSADDDRLIAAKWRGTGYGGNYANIDGIYFGGLASVDRTLEGGLKPGLSYTPLGFQPRLEVDKKDDVVYKSKFIYGDEAKRFAESNMIPLTASLGDPVNNTKHLTPLDFLNGSRVEQSNSVLLCTFVLVVFTIYNIY